jgi:hypothetical protein
MGSCNKPWCGIDGKRCVDCANPPSKRPKRLVIGTPVPGYIWSGQPEYGSRPKGLIMPESKTTLDHIWPDDRFRCQTGDMTDYGFEITIDKRTHEMEIPREKETEETVTVIVRPRATMKDDESV